jgi:hypothetical protein
MEAMKGRNDADETMTGTFTSTGAKMFAHQQAMTNLRNGKGQPIVTHLMPTDVCQHSCAFCSVQTREGNVLPLSVMRGYLELLVPLGLKAVIISGGGNPILYRCPDTKVGFDALVEMVAGFGRTSADCERHATAWRLPAVGARGRRSSKRSARQHKCLSTCETGTPRIASMCRA